MGVQPFPTISLSALLQMEADVEFLVEPLLPLPCAAVLGADAGLGKTWLTLRLALDVAAGQPWLGRFPVRQGTVLVVDEENAIPLLRRRLLKLAHAEPGLELTELPIHFAISQGLNLSDATSVRQFAAVVEALQPSLIILDSLVRVHRAKENSSDEMAAVFARLKDLWRQHAKMAFLFTHHNRKPGAAAQDAANSLRGSGDIRAFVDSQMALRKTEQGLVISQEKARWTEMIQPFSVRIVDTPDDGVEVAYAGASQGRPANPVDEFLLKALEAGPVTRKELVERADQEGVPTRTLDTRLKALVNARQLRKLPRQSSGERPYELVNGHGSK